MNNTVYGKTMKNLRNRIDVKLSSNNRHQNQAICHMKYFDNDFDVIGRCKVCVGMCILDFSKVLMYECHYDYIKNKYGDNSRLLFTNTYTLMYEIKTEDVYKD